MSKRWFRVRLTHTGGPPNSIYKRREKHDGGLNISGCLVRIYFFLHFFVIWKKKKTKEKSSIVYWFQNTNFHATNISAADIRYLYSFPARMNRRCRNRVDVNYFTTRWKQMLLDMMLGRFSYVLLPKWKNSFQFRLTFWEWNTIEFREEKNNSKFKRNK